MIHIDIDGTLIDFIGTAKKFGIEIKPNEFDKWKWADPRFPMPQKFYKRAELQPWFSDLLSETSIDGNKPMLITKEYGVLKQNFICSITDRTLTIYESKNKAARCKYPIDLLIDDNAAECEAWRKKGGIAWHLDLASKTPFEDFLKYWRMGK